MARVTRRGVLHGAIAAGAAGRLLHGAPEARAADASPRRGTGVLLLGTAGGPGWMTTEPPRMGVASAVVVGERFYLVDAGSGVGHQLMRARLGEWERRRPLSALGGIFLTHLHSDHVCDLPSLLTSGLSGGLVEAHGPVPIWGPGNRGAVPEPRPGVEKPPVVSPENPTPGTVEMVASLVAAFATDYNDRAVDLGKPTPDRLFHAYDVPLPESIPFSPNENPHPRMEPFTFFEDDRVRVSATLVQHAPIFPAFAFRFDTDDGSVVFSGDTGPSDNLVRLASGANTLVHEVIASAFPEQRYPAPRTPEEETAYQHMTESHTTEFEVGAIAERAGVKTLVLNHLVPADWPVSEFLGARKQFSGRLLIGRDLDFLELE